MIGIIQRLGSRIKWNPAIKTAADRAALLQGLLDDKLDVIATDHAPHDSGEKPEVSSMPAVVHLYSMHWQPWWVLSSGKIPIRNHRRKMSHAVCRLFSDSGTWLYQREGYWADLVVVDPDYPWTVKNSNILAKCGWSPFEGTTFRSQVSHTFVSGHLTYAYGVFDENRKGGRLYLIVVEMNLRFILAFDFYRYVDISCSQRRKNSSGYFSQGGNGAFIGLTCR